MEHVVGCQAGKMNIETSTLHDYDVSCVSKSTLRQQQQIPQVWRTPAHITVMHLKVHALNCTVSHYQTNGYEINGMNA